MSSSKALIQSLARALTGRNLHRDPQGNIVLARPGTGVDHAPPASTVLTSRTANEVADSQGLYDLLRDRRLKTLIDHYRIDVVVDVGANRGQFGQALRRTGYAGRIVSFEPVERNFQLLQQTAQGDAQWQFHRLALGRENAEIEINVSDSTVFSSFLDLNAWGKTHFGDEAAPSRKEAVSVRRLDAILPQSGLDVSTARILLKMDTQGFDLEAFAGASGLYDRICALQSEISGVPIYDGMPHFTKSLEIYEAAGFKLAGMYPIHADGALSVIEFDCLMVNPKLAR